MSTRERNQYRCFIDAAIPTNTRPQPHKAGILIALAMNGKTEQSHKLPKVTQSEEAELRCETAEVCLISTTELSLGLPDYLGFWKGHHRASAPVLMPLGLGAPARLGQLQRQLENRGGGEHRKQRHKVQLSEAFPRPRPARTWGRYWCVWLNLAEGRGLPDRRSHRADGKRSVSRTPRCAGHLQQAL